MVLVDTKIVGSTPIYKYYGRKGRSPDKQKKVLFKSIRNCKRFKENTFMSNSNKILISGGGMQHYLVLNKLSTLEFHFLAYLHFLIKSNNIFHMKNLKRFTFKIMSN